MKKIVITGANGQVGRSLNQVLNNKNYKCFFLDRMALDLSKPSEIYPILSSFNPDFLVNAAAYTKVDQAEEDYEIAEQINTIACTYMAEYCNEHTIPILHYSSDYVYHNNENRPLLETDETSPKSVYARTKLLGEDSIRKISKRHFIIRTSWVYDAKGKNFVNTMLSLSKKYDRLTVVDDQIGSPTYAIDIARSTGQIIDKYFAGQVEQEEYGIYNFSNEGVCTWYDFAIAIFELSGIKMDVTPVPSTAYARPAARPHFSVLNKGKIRAFLTEYRIPHWRRSLANCLGEIHKVAQQSKR